MAAPEHDDEVPPEFRTVSAREELFQPSVVADARQPSSPASSIGTAGAAPAFLWSVVAAFHARVNTKCPTLALEKVC